jgi:ribosomal protein S18 acetylase RimI-like enzyme
VLPEYGQVSIAFRVTSRLRVESIEEGLGGLRLIEESVEPSYVKDYDAENGGGPERWLRRWDMSNWGVFCAYDGSRWVGGAVVAWKTPGVHMLEERDDLAVLWDIRVHPECRGRGIGTALFQQAVAWARQKGCRQLKVETQNVNVPACRFYARQGCELGAIHRWAYPELPDEVQLLWYLDL